MRRCVFSALAVAVFAAALRAQAADTTVFPPVPSSIPVLRTPPDPADAGFAKWRRVPLPRHDKVPAAWTLRAGDWDFLLGTPRAMDAMDTSQIIDTTLANCRTPLNISPDDSAYAASARPWAPFDSLIHDRPVIVISIMPVLRNFTECGFKNLGRPAMIRRGMRFVTDFAYDPTRDPVSAVVLSRLRIVKATMLARAPVTVVARGGIPRRTTDQLRIYIPYDAIAPSVTGDMPQVELLIWTKGGGEPSHIKLPSDILHMIWWEYLHWRGARLATRPAVTSAAHRTLVPVPTPADTALKTALKREREGRDADASFITLERLADDKLSINDRRVALMSLASVFQADDDAPSAALLGNELTGMDPCALSGSDVRGGAAIGNDAYTGMRSAGALLDHTRPGVRCTSIAPGVTFLRGLILPGYGQAKTWSRIAGWSIGALTVGGAIKSYAFLQEANNSYATYQTIQTGYAPYYRTNAIYQRGQARSLAAATVALWLGAAVEAEVQERIHASRLNVVHEFWFRPIVTSPNAAGGGGAGGAGMAGGFKFEFR
jgi:hypothetical protein